MVGNLQRLLRTIDCGAGGAGLLRRLGGGRLVQISALNLAWRQRYGISKLAARGTVTNRTSGLSQPHHSVLEGGGACLVVVEL